LMERSTRRKVPGSTVATCSARTSSVERLIIGEPLRGMWFTTLCCMTSTIAMA